MIDLKSAFQEIAAPGRIALAVGAVAVGGLLIYGSIPSEVEQPALGTLAQAGWSGWTSLHVLNFFGWCFGSVEQGMSRQRELLADRHAAQLTSPAAAARAILPGCAMRWAQHPLYAQHLAKAACCPRDSPNARAISASTARWSKN